MMMIRIWYHPNEGLKDGVKGNPNEKDQKEVSKSNMEL